MSIPSRWIVSQIGSREHYAVPRALHQRGLLDALVTDAWCRHGAALLRRGPRRARGLAGRFHPGLRDAAVHAFTLRTLLDEARRPGADAGSTEAQFRHHARIGRDFALRVNRLLEKRRLDPRTHAFFGYDTGCLETLQLLQGRGILSLVDQIDPARVEEQMVFEEAQRWPGWQAMPGRIPDDYYERLAAEWRAASLVLVNSDWSRQALMQQGVPPEKIIVVPLAYETEAPPPAARPAAGAKPLVVLWLGSVILRKGIQYLVEAARLLERAPIRFVVAGPVGISQRAMAQAPGSVEFIGHVSRDRAPALFRAADVFVLPTLSDGFAITQIEAMAHGLPVVATPNCGRVVADGVDGLIVPARDAGGLAQALTRLEEDRGLLAEMSRRAAEKARCFSLANLVSTLEDQVAKATAARSPTGAAVRPS